MSTWQKIDAHEWRLDGEGHFAVIDLVRDNGASPYLWRVVTTDKGVGWRFRITASGSASSATNAKAAAEAAIARAEGRINA